MSHTVLMVTWYLSECCVSSESDCAVTGGCIAQQCMSDYWLINWALGHAKCGNT